MLQECLRSARSTLRLRRCGGAARLAASIILGLQILYLTPAISFAISAPSERSSPLAPSNSQYPAALRAVPQNSTSTGAHTAADYGTSLGEGLALVTTTLTTDPSIPIVPFTGTSPSEAPIIEASTGQVIAPIVQSLPAHTDFKVSILIGGRAVRIASLKSASATSIAIPPMIGLQIGTWLIQITSKQSKYFYKVMFTSLL